MAGRSHKFLPLAALLLSTCGGPSGVLVDIGTWPGAAVSLLVTGDLDGTQQLVPLHFTAGTARFVVYLPEGSRGQLRLEIEALDQNGCPRAVGAAHVEVGTGLRRIAEVVTSLSPKSEPYCETPWLDSITPALVPDDRQSLLTLRGRGFRSGATVTIGGADCGSPTVTDTEIRCTSPTRPRSCGTQPVIVKNPDGQVATRATGFGFYSAVPAFPRGPQPTYATGAFPRRVVAADWNGDGKPDLATANQSGSSLTVLLGNGDGTLRAGPTLRTTGASTLNGVVAGDFDGDRKADLVATASTNSFTLYSGNGDGTFKPGVNVTTGYAVTEGTAADLNGDGKLDLLMCGTAGLLVALGNGDGTFQATARYGAPSQTRSAVAADFDGDQIPDVVTSDLEANLLSVFIGSGNGTLKPAVSGGATGSKPGALVAVDLNGDRKMDVIVANTSEPSVGLFLGNGDGTFGAMTRVATGDSPESVLAADVNGDGVLDLVTANSVANTWSFIPGRSGGGFEDPVVFSAGNGSAGAAIADLNGDGSPDVVTANGYDSTVAIFLQQCK